MNRLLIVACSQSKSATPGELCAIDRYDGPVFRVLRKFLREQPNGAPVVFVLSAKYGLIGGDARIKNYDQMLTLDSATRMRPRVLAVLEELVSDCEWEAIGICAGRVYLAALDGMRSVVPSTVPLQLIIGGQGRRLSALKHWLYATA